MARPKSPIKAIHTAVRLPQPLHQRLTETGRGALAEEIKKRLLASLLWDGMDASTKDLLSGIYRMAHLIQGDTDERWHENAFSRAALAEAITAWLADRVPGDASAPKKIAASSAWLHPGDRAKVAGEKLFRVANLMEKSHRALEPTILLQTRVENR